MNTFDNTSGFEFLEGDEVSYYTTSGKRIEGVVVEPTDCFGYATVRPFTWANNKSGLGLRINADTLTALV